MAPAVRDEVILKLGVPHPELTPEIEALSLYDGRGCAKLLEVDRGLGALLLERLKPGSSLQSVADDDEATQIAAGVMHEAIEQRERVDFGAMFSKRNQFVLEVSGDSMIDAQISDGDYVVVKKQRTATSGQMVVAQTEDGEATLKYWYPERHRVRLQPANSRMKPIYSKNVQVLGVVVGVVRKLV